MAYGLKGHKTAEIFSILCLYFLIAYLAKALHLGKCKDIYGFAKDNNNK
jgi:hypothetical protein